jgi:hypothetical protein
MVLASWRESEFVYEMMGFEDTGDDDAGGESLANGPSPYWENKRVRRFW